jgi:hypothetical protein
MARSAGDVHGKTSGEEDAVKVAPPVIAPLDLRLLAGASFGAVLADPPWRYVTWSARGRDRCPDHKPIEGYRGANIVKALQARLRKSKTPGG